MYAGRDWQYKFRELNMVFEGASAKRVADSLLQRYARLTKHWSAEKNLSGFVEHILQRS